MPFTSPPSNAGATAADPLLNGLRFEVVFGSTTFDVASVTDAGMDQASGTTVANSVRPSLSPAFNVATGGSAGSYNDTSKTLTISSTAGLTAGDYLEIAHAAINGAVARAYKIASVASGTTVTLANDPFTGLGNKTAISYQVAWRYLFTAGAGGTVSSAGGTQNYAKFKGADAAGNVGFSENSFYVRNAPSGAAFVALGGQDAGAAAGTNATPTLEVLNTWANRGGVATLAWANHPTYARNDFSWNDSSTGEKPIAAALGSPLKTTAGDGLKAGQLVMRSAAGSPVTVTFNVVYTIDTTAPTVEMYLSGV